MKLDLLAVAAAAAAQVLLVTCVLLRGVGAGTVDVKFITTKVFRTEGRITLVYESKTQKARYEFAFSEVVDSKTKRSKITIGLSSSEPTIYYARDDVMLAKNSKTGRYERVTGGTNAAPKFVPELDWFFRLTYTDEELREHLPDSESHRVGPSGILRMLTRHQTKYDRRDKFRNINCAVMTARYGRTKASSILLENFMPDFQFHDTTDDMNYFSLRETVSRAKDPKNALLGTTFDAILTLDYFSTERIDKKNSVQLEKLERDLSMPLGEGVSEFLKPYIFDAASDSFIMTYDELNNPESQLSMLAYDHQFNYLRKEAVGSSVSVWDLNEDLLYHVDLTIQGSLTNSLNIEVPLEQCSVLSVEPERSRKEKEEEDADARPAGMERPYKTPGTSLKLTEFLGAGQLVYMARSTVRDLPCSVFETILPEAPKIFQLNLVHSPQLRSKAEKPSTTTTTATDERVENEYDFIVQYHLLGTSPEYAGINIGANQLDVINNLFWPARINLYRRQKSTGAIGLVNSLEIADFHLGLYGWTRKPSQLFMMPQCFDQEDEQLRVSLQLDFRPQLNAEDQKQVALSKYKLEFDLMNKLFRTLDLSRLHMTEYEFALQRRGQVSASFVISDRMQDKRVSYFGEGELPSADSYENNRIELQGGHVHSAESCLMGASHIKDVSLVIHCPAQAGKVASDWPTCTAVFGETQPVVKLSRAGRVTPCQAYLFETREPPKSGVKSVASHPEELEEFEFEFATRDPAAGSSLFKTKKFTCWARDFEVTRAQQLVTISNYHFVLPTPLEDSKSGGVASSGDDTELAPASCAGESASAAAGQPVQQEKLCNVRHIGSIVYESAGDCARICNLDANCRSYSYCRKRDTSGKPGKQSWDVAASQDSKPVDAQEAATRTSGELERTSEAVRCVLSSLDLRANNVDNQLMNARVDTTNNQIEVKDLQLAAKGSSLGVYRLEMVSGCDVYERDIMSIFTPTEELVRVDAHTLGRVHIATSVSECARNVVALEAKSAHTGASFAYCPRTQACLTDENLFGSIELKSSSDKNNSGGGGGGNDDNDDNENADGSKQVACELYRKRYQTYFHLSPSVMKRIDVEGQKPAHANIIRHVDLNLGTVEECAHACWQSYGHVCLSFDYCSPGLCSLNIVDDKSASSGLDVSSIEYETRAGCLGYRRDLRWDQLRREHLIGSHNPLGLELRPAAHTRGRGLFLNLVLMCLSAVLFAAGLLVGRVFNDQLEIATSSWRSQPGDGPADSSGPTARPFASTFGRGRGRANGGTERLSTNSKFNIENEIYEDPDAIRMEDFGGGQNALTNLHEDNDDASASELPVSPAPADKKPTDDQRRAGYMDIPDLL